MQPSSRCPRVIPSVACVKHLRQIVFPTRSFSTTARLDVRTSRARRAFFQWIGTKGKNFRNPLPGSTNYLNAYTREGVLRRVLINNTAKLENQSGKERAEARGEKFFPMELLPPPLKETPESAAKAPLSQTKAEKAAKEAELAEKFAKKAAESKLEVATKYGFTLPSRSVKDKPEEVAVEKAPELDLIPEELNADLYPFPANKAFQSQPVLSLKFRQKIWEAVILEGKSVREVSVAHNVEMSRVGAVVRLMEVQKEWERINKPMAIPYETAVMDMLPKTLWVKDQDIDKDRRPKPHESINDLPVHRATGQQIFHPTSESRVFTRADAAKVFHEKLLPADDRIPHPDLAIAHREYLEGVPEAEREQRQATRLAAELEKSRVAAEKRAQKEAAVKKVAVGKWEYRISSISVDAAGKDGRGRRGVGWRYGAPLMDRKKGDVRIPTTVEG